MPAFTVTIRDRGTSAWVIAIIRLPQETKRRKRINKREVFFPNRKERRAWIYITNSQFLEEKKKSRVQCVDIFIFFFLGVGGPGRATTVWPRSQHAPTMMMMMTHHRRWLHPSTITRRDDVGKENDPQCVCAGEVSSSQKCPLLTSRQSWFRLRRGLAG